jgi:NhaA family Na+:H+ antiporter
LLKHKLRKTAKKARGRFSRVLQLLLEDEAISGKLLLLAASAAIFIVNSPWAASYVTFWEYDLSLSIGGFTIAADLRHWVNDGLMAIFFLVISLEIKRELVRGELRKIRAAILPVIAAIGGIAVPIAIYSFINKDSGGMHGWGIPMTTDTAFAIALLALLGKRIPTSLKIFLLTVMVIDDVAAIIAIAVFYTHAVNILPLIIAGLIYTTILVLHWLRFLRMRGFIALGIILWICVYLSGVHASIAGVILGLVAPISIRHYTNKLSIAERLERSLIPFSTLIIIPLFALANAGILLDWQAFNEETALRAGAGIFLGLVVGKTVGIFTCVWLATKLHLAKLPKNTTMRHIGGVSVLAGVGFTLSIFIAELAFGTTSTLLNAAKLSIFTASVVSAIAGLLYLAIAAKPKKRA